MEDLTIAEKQRVEEMSLQMQYKCTPQQARELREVQEMLVKMKEMEKTAAEKLAVVKARSEATLARLDYLDAVAKRREEELALEKLQRKSWIHKVLAWFQ